MLLCAVEQAKEKGAPQARHFPSAELVFVAITQVAC
jgi:hypothetical protein